MDWQTILTSGVIAAIVTGIIELIKQGNSNKARYIIEQREEWREKIRDIADEIHSSSEKNIETTLTKLRMRINPYGEYMDKPDKQKIKEDFKKEKYYQEEYYLNDGHIFEVIRCLEKNEEFKENKKLLIAYLSELLKFDWERSKKETTVNRKAILSLVLFVLSVGVIIYIMSDLTRCDTLWLILYIVCGLVPTSLILFYDSYPVTIRKVTENRILNAIGIVFIFLAILGFLLVFIKQNNIYIIPQVFTIISLLISWDAIEDQRKSVTKYIKAIERLNKKQNEK